MALPHPFRSICPATGFILSTIGVMAVILAVSGVYGVTSFVVAQRTREIGIRMARGAEAGKVRQAVTRGAVGLAIAGAGIGAVLAFATSRTLAGLLFEVQATDARTYVLAAVTFIIFGWLGSYVPARRATRVDPIRALRAE